MLSLSTEYYQILLSQGICASVGASMIFCESFAIVFRLRLHRPLTLHSLIFAINPKSVITDFRPDPAMSTTTTWFFKKRGLAFGIIAAGSSLGGVILPIMVSR